MVELISEGHEEGSLEAAGVHKYESPFEHFLCSVAKQSRMAREGPLQVSVQLFDGMTIFLKFYQKLRAFNFIRNF
jgi:hypothetical protein